MSDAPKTIWAWYFTDPDQNEYMQGGWTDKPDKRETEYVRADLADALAAALEEIASYDTGATAGLAYTAKAALAAYEGRK